VCKNSLWQCHNDAMMVVQAVPPSLRHCDIVKVIFCTLYSYTVRCSSHGKIILSRFGNTFLCSYASKFQDKTSKTKTSTLNTKTLTLKTKTYNITATWTSCNITANSPHYWRSTLHSSLLCRRRWMNPVGRRLICYNHHTNVDARKFRVAAYYLSYMVAGLAINCFSI